MRKHMRETIVRVGCALVFGSLTPLFAGAEEMHAHVPSIADLSLHYINFVIYLAILAYFVPSAFRTAWAARRQRIANAVTASQQLLERADAKLANARAQLSRASSDAETVRLEIEKHAKLEAAKMVDDARAKSLQIMARAKTLAAAERRAALSKVRREVVDQVISQAQQIISSGHTAQKDQALRSAALSGVKQIVH